MTRTTTTRPIAALSVRSDQAVIGLLVGFEMILGVCIAFLHFVIGLGVNFHMKLVVEKLETLKTDFPDNAILMKMINDPEIAKNKDLANFNFTITIMTMAVFLEIFLALVTIIKLFQKKRIPYTILILLLLNPVPWEFFGLTSIVQAKNSNTAAYLVYLILLGKLLLGICVLVYNARVVVNSKINARKIEDKFIRVGQEMNNFKLNNKNIKGNASPSDEKKLLTLSA